MCRNSKTKSLAGAATLACMLLVSSSAGAEQSEPKYTSLGHESTAFGMGAIAIGWAAEARGDGSIAIGSQKSILSFTGTSATNGGIAIGAGSKSNVDGDVNFGDRTLSGLRDGVHDNEAVTVRQMNAARAYTDTVKNDLVRLVDPAGSPLLSAAKAYTDQSGKQTIAAANKYSDALRKETLAEGKKFAEQLLAGGRVQDNTKLLAQAKSYSDQRNAVIQENAQVYSEKVGRAVLSSANAYTDERSQQAQDRAVELSRQYTDRRVGQFHSQLKQLRRRAYGGISGAMAMTTLTPPPATANTSFGMALATYRNQLALASGVTFRTGKTSNLRLNTSWDSAGGIGAAAGFNMAW